MKIDANKLIDNLKLQYSQDKANDQHLIASLRTEKETLLEEIEQLKNDSSAK